MLRYFAAALMLHACTLLAAPAALAEEASFKLNTTADHSKFKELQRPFASGPEVTAACLTCHTEAAKQVQRTKHWKWEFLNPESKQRLGKKNVLNNFCISIPSNYPYCTSCHIGYGWKDANFDFTNENNVDCLVCHDTTGGYKKYPGFAGHPLYEDTEIAGRKVKAPDLSKIARKVGKTSRDNCGACHFYGGGGDGVKHGDMDSSLAAPDKALDVHMDSAGLDFTCGTCHRASSHDIPGSRYTLTAMDKHGMLIRGQDAKRNPATCVACHSNAPHHGKPRLNLHATKIACQTCHIPTIARGGVATKINWDWSTAGKLNDGKPIVVKDDHGHVTYDSRKGDFKLAQNFRPEYLWFNGSVRYTLLSDKVVASDKAIGINNLDGSPTDGKSLIWPVKIFRGQQPYDTVNQTLITPHNAGNDDTAFWKNFGWEKALAAGMAESKAPFSGKFGFIKTQMSWPITHMVAPKSQAVPCGECHTRENSRLAGITGVYMPGRDYWPWIDAAMWIAAAGALIASAGHGGIRWRNARRRKNGKGNAA